MRCLLIGCLISSLAYSDDYGYFHDFITSKKSDSFIIHEQDGLYFNTDLACEYIHRGQRCLDELSLYKCPLFYYQDPLALYFHHMEPSKYYPVLKAYSRAFDDCRQKLYSVSFSAGYDCLQGAEMTFLETLAQECKKELPRWNFYPF